MTCSKKLSSFPNTRQRPRKPTKIADTKSYDMLEPINIVGTVDVDAILALGNEVQEADEGDYTLKDNLIVKAFNQDRTYLSLRNGHSGESIRYGYADHADLGSRGMLLRAGDSVDIESPQTIFVAHDADTTIAGETLEVIIDYGEG